MKLIIDIPEEQYNDIVKHLTDNDGNYAYSDFNLREIIRNGTPYEPKGDLISREALKDITYINKGNFNTVEGIREWIDNAPPVEAKQGELLDYIKLSLKHSDELQEKYRNKHKESNSQHDLYYSHLFEGMAEAYDDLLKKIGESDTQGKHRPQGEWIIVKDEKYGDNVKCPFCGKEIAGTDLNFCVKCGADMRKGEAQDGQSKMDD